ncbi:lysylphosphatidylglycerol synthase transmembrane domain-containing protein [Marinobacter halotolerans]|uniref:lysylphosphatidylglycerol synthase transmembrane domain-containing protein n=1 Tax=Marinobacter halotolerans TaxID=1569211 RepID=UPI0012488D9E|nr:lysylphosphatidylglycerol synthase transmembrane domain-containing protein [Marinobacter halotolerans]
MSDSRPSVIRVPLAARWLLTLVFLGLLGWFLDLEQLVVELSRFSLLAVGMALLVSVAQVALSAWRWRYTARRLGLGLTMKAAVTEYYLAMFLNQCLPGGVMGDVNRAWRHGSGSGERQKALHGVMIERLSGQLVMFAVAVCGGFWLIAGHPDLQMLADNWANGVIGPALVLIAVFVLVLGLGSRAWQGLRRYLATLGRDIYRGLLNPRSLPLQIVSSLLVVASYLGVFWLLAASGREGMSAEQTLTLLALCSLLLLAMVIPLTVAGWGVREGAAAVLWPLAGLPAEQGVALSVGYGLTVLLSSLPGGLFVFSRASAGR